MPKLYEVGFSQLMFAALTETEGAAPRYAHTPRKIKGAMEYSGTLTRNRSSIAADDDPDYIVMKGNYRGDITIKITGIPVNDISYISDVVQADNGVLGYGENTPDKYVGMKFTRKVTINGVEYLKEQMYHKVLCEPPEVTGKSKDENGAEIADISIVAHVKPLIYLAGDGSIRMRTMSQVSSDRSPAAYAALRDICYTPAEADGASIHRIALVCSGTQKNINGMSLQTVGITDTTYYPPVVSIVMDDVYMIDGSDATYVFPLSNNTEFSLNFLEAIGPDNLSITVNGVQRAITSGTSFPLPATGNIVITIT